MKKYGRNNIYLLPLLLCTLLYTEKLYAIDGVDNLIYFGDRLVYNDTLPTWANYLSSSYGKTFQVGITNFANPAIPPIPPNTFTDLLQQRTIFYQTNPVFNPNNIFITSTSHYDFFYYSQVVPPPAVEQILDQDYRDAFGNWNPVVNIGPNTDLFFNQRVGAAADHIRDLVSHGAHNHIVLNHFDESLLRYELDPLTHLPDLPPGYTKLIEAYNDKLVTALSTISGNILVPDLYLLTKEIYQNQASYIPAGGELYSRTVAPPMVANNDMFTDAGHKIINQYIGSLIDAPLLVGQVMEIPLKMAELHIAQITQELQYKDSFKNASLLIGGQTIKRKSTVNNHIGCDGNTSEVNLMFMNHFPIPETTLGIALGQYHHLLHFNNQMGKALVNETLASFFSKTSLRTFNALALMIGIGYINYDIDRNIPLGLTTRTEEGKTNGFHFFSDAKLNFEVTTTNGTIVQPFLGLELQRVASIDYREAGETRSTTMSFNMNHRDSVKPYFGVDIQKIIHLRENYIFIPSINFKIDCEIVQNEKSDFKASVSDIPLTFHAFYPLKSQEITSQIQLGGALQKNHIRFGIYYSTVQDFNAININQIYAKISFIM